MDRRKEATMMYLDKVDKDKHFDAEYVGLGFPMARQLQYY